MVDEGFFVADDVRVLDGCQDADLVERILLLFLREVAKLDLLESILLGILDALDAVHGGICAFT
jgi:hypothetical protein